jgi:hypothetical protein
MKFVVPFTMPITRSMRSPASDVRKRAKYRNASTDRRLVEEVGAILSGEFGEFGPALGHEGLVGRHDRDAVLEGRFDVRPRRLDPPANSTRMSRSSRFASANASEVSSSGEMPGRLLGIP